MEEEDIFDLEHGLKSIQNNQKKYTKIFIEVHTHVSIT